MKEELDINSFAEVENGLEWQHNYQKSLQICVKRIDPISSSCSTMLNGLNFLFKDQHRYTKHLSCFLSSIASLY